jgi:membrane peptidoglycan carboxypeptidase
VGAGRASAGGAGGGRAPAGRATVSNPGGYQYDDEPAAGRPAGRAVVGSAAVGSVAVGRPVSGRATVAPISPGGPAGPMGPGGPGGPGRPGAGGPGRGTPDGPPGAAKRRKKQRRRNWLIAGFALFIMMSGGTVVAGTYYYDSVPPPNKLNLPESSVVLTSSGTVIAKLGDQNREIVPISAVPDLVQKAVISAEDRNYMSHGGIDIKGIVRAAWNNISGGDTQGASTITQQYARAAADLTGVNYGRKVREAVMASKLNQEYTKEEILGFYLNTIYEGRGAYGIQAAAKAYFGVNVDKLTVGEGAVLAALIKQPEPSATHKGYDPAINLPAAQDRWNYVMDGLVAMHAITADERAKTPYPKVLAPPKSGTCLTDCGIATPAGNVVNYVKEELSAMGINNFVKDGGYKITTTIDPKMQDAAQSASRRVAGSPMQGQPKNLQSALVAVQPSTGRVLAYYGGEKGTDFDYAGVNVVNGVTTGGHAPGSSFKIYTLAAGLKENISMQSYWDATKDKDGPVTISNAGRVGNQIICHPCTLDQSTVQSYNVPFYWIAKKIGPQKVVEAAKAAGIQTMWSNDLKAVDLTSANGLAQASDVFDSHVGFGQYPITVLDHANGLATLANGGKYLKAHFVVKVEKKNPVTGKYELAGAEKLNPQRKFDQGQVDDILHTLQKIPGTGSHQFSLADGRPAAAKTGTWELNSSSDQNGDAWTIGATPQVAAASWIGTNTSKREAIVDKNGANIGGSALPGQVWKKFMDAALNGQQIEQFPPAANTGDVNAGDTAAPTQNTTDQNQPTNNNPACVLFPASCTTTNGNGNGNGNGRHG